MILKSISNRSICNFFKLTYLKLILGALRNPNFHMELLDYWYGGWINNSAIIILFKPNNPSVISMYNYHPIMSNEQMNNHTHTQYTSFLCGNPKQEKTTLYVSYMSWRITFIGSTNFLFFPAAIGRRLQPRSFSGYNLRESPTP